MRCVRGLVSYKEHAAGLTCVDWSRDGRLVATGDYQGAIRLWQPESGQTSLVYTEHEVADQAWIASVTFSNDGSRLVSVHAVECELTSSSGSTVGWELTMHIWDANTGQTEFTHSLGEVAYSLEDEDYIPRCTTGWFPDGRRVFVYGPGALVHVIDTQDWGVATLKLPDDQMDYTACLSPSGLTFATTSRRQGKEELSVWSFS